MSLKENRRSARITGAIYLIVAVFAGFAFAATGAVYVPGDAAATAQNIAANAGLVRAATVADLVQATAWILTGMAFYRLLRHVSEVHARAVVVFIAVGAAVIFVSEAFRIAALAVATGPAYATAFGSAGASALALLALDLHHYGLTNVAVFYGLWLIPLGVLVYRSGMFPKALGALLVVGGVCYPIGVLAVYVVPSSGEAIKNMLTNVATIAEVWLLGYLLSIGVRSPRLAVGTAEVTGLEHVATEG